MARQSKTLVTVPDREEAQQYMTQYASAVGNINKLKAEMELKIQAIRQRYQTKIDPHQKVQAETFEKIQAWAVEHKEEDFVRKKSQDWGVAVLGFRVNPPKVKALKGFTLKAALALIIERGLSFTKQKIELNKELIIESREDEAVMESMRSCGLTVIQEEGFFIDVKEEEIA